MHGEEHAPNHLNGSAHERLAKELLAREEPWRATPLRLRERIDQGIRVAILRRQLSKRFRIAAAAFAASILIALACIGTLLVVTDLNELMRYGIAGAAGRIDSMVAFAEVSWWDYQGGYSLMASCVAAALAIGLGLYSWLGRLAQH